ncbi:MAG: hypothetical protein V4485_03110 [Pseudomonadota bacterium]
MSKRSITTTNTINTAFNPHNNSGASLARERDLSTGIVQATASSGTEKIDVDVIFTTLTSVTSIFTAKVSYLNLDKLESLVQDSALRKKLSHIKEGDVISFQIVGKEDANNIHEPSLPGKVLDTDRSGSTLIKTPFGLISSEAHLNIGNGREILLRINSTQINSSPISPHALQAEIAELLSRISQNMQNLQLITNGLYSNYDLESYRIFANLLVQRKNSKASKKILNQSRMVSANEVEKWIEEEILGPMSGASEHNIIKQLEPLIRDIQKRLHSESEDSKEDKRWQTIIIPIFNGSDMKECKVFVRGSSDPGHFIRFVADIEMTANKMQLDGLMHFTKHGSRLNHVDHLELTLRMQTLLDHETLNAISKIFLAHQYITGIKGMIKFEESKIMPTIPTDTKPDTSSEQSIMLSQDA